MDNEEIKALVLRCLGELSALENAVALEMGNMTQYDEGEENEGIYCDLYNVLGHTQEAIYQLEEARAIL